MSKLSEALGVLGFYMSQDKNLGNMELETLHQSNDELYKLQRLQSTVKEFIDDYDLKKCSDIKSLDYDELQDFIKDCCSIVGYSE